MLIFLVHLGAPRVHNYNLFVTSPNSLFKCPFNAGIDHISHSGQIWITLLSHGTVTILVHFGALWWILMHFGDLMSNPMSPPWLALTPIPFQMSIYSRNGSYLTLKTNSKYFALSCSIMAWWPFWSVLVHFVAFCCTSYAMPWPLYELFRLLSPFKCPSNPEIDHVGHSGWICKTFAVSCYFDHFGLFWSILVHFMGDPTSPLYWIFIKS